MQQNRQLHLLRAALGVEYCVCPYVPLRRSFSLTVRFVALNDIFSDLTQRSQKSLLKLVAFVVWASVFISSEVMSTLTSSNSF